MNLKDAQKKLNELLDAPTSGNLAEAKRVVASLTESASAPEAEKRAPAPAPDNKQDRPAKTR